MALGFRDTEALTVVVRSGLCPADVLARGAQVGRGDGGTIVIAPEKELTKAALAKLRAVGVAIDAVLPETARAVRCWAEALAPVPVGVAAVPALVIFATNHAAEVLDIAAELVRLGCDRLDLSVTADTGFVRVVDPPTYTVVRALDRDRGLRVFGPDPVGQEVTWTELGYRHPLAEFLKVEASSLLLVGTDRWRTAFDGNWHGLDHALELAVPGETVKHKPTKLPERRKVELRLSTGRREVPSLWVMREHGVAMVDKLLEYLPEEIVSRLTFAVAGDLVILRARTGRYPAPDLSLGPLVEEYAPLGQMSDVYAPTGAIVEPPLRRERLRTILGIGTAEVMWLARTEIKKFRVERISDSAFSPLSEWADYVIHASAPALQPWLRASVFDFAAYTSTGLEWASAPAPTDEPEDPSDPKRRKRAKVRSPALEEPPIAIVKPVLQSSTPMPKAKTEAPVSMVAIDAELAQLEAEFVALDAPGDAPERIELLGRLGHVYARLDRRRDAGLCFVRAAWESPELLEQLDAWIAADLAGRDPKAALDKALAMKVPGTDEVRLVAALAARGVPAVVKNPHKVQRWLDDFDGELDARALWLSRLGLASLAGGDALGLAHARDRILARLAGGLPVERELPAFLRFAGRSGALGNASGEHLGNALEDLLGRVAKTRRKRSPVEAAPHLTNAYVAFQIAVGFARIGNVERAKVLVAEAQAALVSAIAEPENGVAHWYLASSYAARVEQAIAGTSPETPLPAELVAELEKRCAALDAEALAKTKPGDAPKQPSRIVRYKIDRLREVSRILEPIERLDAIGAFSKRQTDSRGPEFDALRKLGDAAARVRAVDGIAQLAAAANDADKERLIDGILDVLLELPEAGAVPVLARAVPLVATLPLPRRAILYAEALVVAGHFGRTEMVPQLLEVLSVAIRAVSGTDLERVLQESLRALRRIGLRREIAELLAEAEKALPQGRAEALRGRLALAAGLAFLGDSARALPVFEQARTALSENMTLTQRLELTRALALAYSQAPLTNALAGIADLANQLKDITDSFGTNSHYCLSVLNFIESLVLGITSDDLALGEAGRRFVEDDEHLIRRRLHRDLGGTT